MFGRKFFAHLDWVLLGTTVAISAVGILTIYSASQGYTRTDDYWLRQLIWLGVGLACGVTILLIEPRTIGHWGLVAHGILIAALVVLPLLSPSSTGVTRWLQLGPVSIQPSEFIKFTSVLATAYCLRAPSGRSDTLGLRNLLPPLLCTLIPFYLIVRQPDLGTALILAMVFVPTLLAAGINRRILIAAGVLCTLGSIVLILSFSLQFYRFKTQALRQLEQQGVPVELLVRAKNLQNQRFLTLNQLQRAAVKQGLPTKGPMFEALADAARKPYISFVLRPYQQRRITTFLNPEKDPLGAGYHVIQSKVAVGSGGLAGKGYLKSTQGALNFLPARHTDFVFSIFAEEWGFLGAVLLLALYGVWLGRSLLIAQESNDRFSAFAVFGVTLIVFVQFMINTGMALGMLPVVGVPLPFFSYGGSSMVSSWVGVAFILNVRMRRFSWG